MVALVAELLGRGVAYETGDGVYLDVSQVPGYGLLARQSLDSLRAGARVEADEEKRSPLDFAIWKKAKPGEPRWEAPWEPDGRVGTPSASSCRSISWATVSTCTAAARTSPSRTTRTSAPRPSPTGRTFTRHWVHNGWVEVEGTKMSKSLGNFTSLTDMLERSDARAYRLLVLRAHYRSPIEVTTQTVADAEKGLDRLDTLARRFGARRPAGGERPRLRGRGDDAGGRRRRSALASFSGGWTTTSILRVRWRASSSW